MKLFNCLPLSATSAIVAAAASLGLVEITQAQLAEPDLSCPLVPKQDGLADRAESLSTYVVEVRSSEELLNAVRQAKPSTEIRLRPGVYKMDSTLWVGVANLSIVGTGASCRDVVLQGPGMENKQGGESAPHGIWSNSAGLHVENISIEQYYYHGIILNADADNPRLTQVRIIDTGQQQLKANPKAFGEGVDNGVVQSSVFAYTTAPTMNDHGGGTGYTNGVDVHGGSGWQIRHSLFANFHTPDNADHLWNPAILMWNGASDTLVEANTFYQVDRAVAFGLIDRELDHQGGRIVNNTVMNPLGLFSDTRRANADAFILVYSSPNTVVAHNSFLSNDSVNLGVELRFDSSNAQVLNNLGDKPTRYRESPDKNTSWLNAENITLSASSQTAEQNSLSARQSTSAIAGFYLRPTLIDDSALKVRYQPEYAYDQYGLARQEPKANAGALAYQSFTELEAKLVTADEPETKIGVADTTDANNAPQPAPTDEPAAPRAPSRLTITVK